MPVAASRKLQVIVVLGAAVPCYTAAVCAASSNTDSQLHRNTCIRPACWCSPCCGSKIVPGPTCDFPSLKTQTHLELPVVEERHCLRVEQRINSLAGGQVVQLVHLLAHFYSSLAAAGQRSTAARQAHTGGEVVQLVHSWPSASHASAAPCPF